MATQGEIKITRRSQDRPEMKVEKKTVEIRWNGDWYLWQATCQSQSNIVAINLTWQRYAATLRGVLHKARTDRTDPEYGFIYCRTHSAQGYKTYANVLVRCEGCFWHHSGGRCAGRGLQRQVSDKNEKRYVNFVGTTDVKIKPFIWNSTVVFFIPSHPVSSRLDGKYMTLWAKLEIYLFTHGFGIGFG